MPAPKKPFLRLVHSQDDAPPDSYRLIWEAIRRRRQTTFVYEKRQRECCPVILGYSEKGERTVFAFQFAGETSNPSSKLPQWRCFALAKINDLQSRDGPWHEGTSHSQAQTCVRFVDVDVNIPDTLKRPAPLPFGSPLLRAPRKA